jgi:hypothetical protein
VSAAVDTTATTGTGTTTTIGAGTAGTASAGTASADIGLTQQAPTSASSYNVSHNCYTTVYYATKYA